MTSFEGSITRYLFPTVPIWTMAFAPRAKAGAAAAMLRMRD